ncbi:LEA type 2 family protein [bacterium]|nr:LEA type 2 family protein [bacterium]
MRMAVPLLLSCLLGTSVLAGCSGVPDFIAERQAIAKAEFSFDRVELQHMDIPVITPNAKADLRVILKVKNPNAVTARLDRLDYEVFMEGHSVGTGAMTEDFSVEPGGTKELSLPVAVPYANLPQPALQALLARRAQFRLKGISHVSTPLGRIDYPFEVEHTATF